MKLVCDNEKIEKGFAEILKYLREDISTRFSCITAKAGEYSVAHVANDVLDITYYRLCDFYLLLAMAQTNDAPMYELKAERRVENAGIMADCARNGVLRVESAKRLLAISALLGYSYFELYVEDCMEVDDEPYFGYMRGRFTQAEIREIDAYAMLFGIELVPCVQTLAHLERLFFHWREYAEIQDKGDVLLVGEPRTYKLLENVISTCARCFTSRRINIGMDEAFQLGLGRYMQKHGYRPSGEIIREHLAVVLEICRKYGFAPTMWADMFYEDLAKGSYKDIPVGVELIYWDYSLQNVCDLKTRFAQLKQSGAQYSFAGGATKWLGFAPHNRYACKTLNRQLQECVDGGVTQFLVTAWGDEGAEASPFSILPTLCYFGAHNIGADVHMASRFCEIISGYTYEEFCTLDALNLSNDEDLYNPCKHLLYIDPLIGVEEVCALPEYPSMYEEVSKRLEPLAERDSEYAYLFRTALALSRVLETKSYLVEELYFAYRKGKDALVAPLQKLEESCRRVQAFIRAYATQWRKDNKELGFEVAQMRLYGLLGRLTDISVRLHAYLDGELDKIEELEETKYFQPLENGEYKGMLYHSHAANITYGKI